MRECAALNFSRELQWVHHQSVLHRVQQQFRWRRRLWIIGHVYAVATSTSHGSSCASLRNTYASLRNKFTIEHQRDQGQFLPSRCLLVRLLVHARTHVPTNAFSALSLSSFSWCPSCCSTLLAIASRANSRVFEYCARREPTAESSSTVCSLTPVCRAYPFGQLYSFQVVHSTLIVNTWVISKTSRLIKDFVLPLVSDNN